MSRFGVVCWAVLLLACGREASERPVGVHLDALRVPPTLHVDAVAGPDVDDLGHSFARIEGTASVGPSGSLRYAVPLWVSPGPRGIEPELVLRYDSSSSVHGLVGAGWTVGGMVDQISRCQKDALRDGARQSVAFSNLDALCLNGVRLVEVPGADFWRPENDGATIVRSRATPSGQSFEVVRQGRRQTYGDTVGSRVEGVLTQSSPASSGGVPVLNTGAMVELSWALTSDEDLSGARAEYQYELRSTPAGVERLLSSIVYGQKPALVREVRFVYEDRWDWKSMWVSGLRIGVRSRLGRVEARYRSVLVRTHKFSYSSDASLTPDLLASVSECDADSVCSSPLEFDYEKPASQLQLFDLFSGWGTIESVDLGDFNGDGCGDLLVGIRDTAQPGWSTLRVVESTGCGTSLRHLDFASSYFFPRRLDRQSQTVQIADVNHDGADDVVFSWRVGSTLVPSGLFTFTFTRVNSEVYLGGVYNLVVGGLSCSHFSCSPISLPPGGSFSTGPLTPPLRTLVLTQWADVDGDGLVDLLRSMVDGSIYWYKNRGVVAQSPGLNGSAIVPLSLDQGVLLKAPGVYASVRLTDSNCDQRAEVSTTSPAASWFSATQAPVGAPPFSWSLALMGDAHRHYSFVNTIGSGCADAMVVDSTTGFVTIAENLGGNFGPASQFGFPSALPGPDPGLRVASLRGLHRSDFVQVDVPGHLGMQVSTYFRGVAVMTPLEIAGNVVLAVAKSGNENQLVVAVGDVDGDGSSEVIRVDADQISVFGLSNSRPFLLQSVRGPGVVEQFEYRTSLDSGVRKSLGLTNTTQQALMGGQWLVSRIVRVSAGRSREISLEYFGGAFARNDGRFLGFSTLVQVDGATRTEERYSDFETGGALVVSTSIRTTLSSGVVLESRTENAWTRPWGLLRLTGRLSSQYEDNLLLSSERSVVGYSPEGQIWSSSKTFLDGTSEVESSPGWAIDAEAGVYVPTDFEHRWVDANGLTEKRLNYHLEYAPQSDRPVLVERSTLPGVRDETFQQVVLDYDPASGEPRTVTTCEFVLGKCKTRSFTYDSVDRQFVVLSVNEEGHVIGFAYEPARGARLVVEDVNQLRSEIQIDTFGMRRAVRPYGGITVATSYSDSGGGAIRISDVGADGSYSSVVADADGLPISQERLGLSGSYAVNREFDAQGVLVSEEIPHRLGESAAKIVRVFDAAHRLTSIVRVSREGQLSTLRTRSYSAETVSDIDAEGRRTSWSLDRRGRVASSTQSHTDAHGQRNLVVSYERRVDGSLAAAEFGGVRREYRFDLIGRSVGGLDPDRGGSSIEYDGFDNPRSISWDSGERIDIERDLLGRETFVSDGSDLTVFVWDTSKNGVGSLSSVSNSHSEWSYKYDAFGRLSGQSLSSRGVTVEFGTAYDQLGRVAGRIFPAPTQGESPLMFLFEYASTGQFVRAADLNGISVEWKQIADSQFGTGEESFGDVNLVHRYDPDTGFLRWQKLSTNVALLEQAFSFNAVGELSARHDRSLLVSEDFQYDDLGRLKRWGVIQSCAAKAQVYDYDDLSNLTSVSIDDANGSVVAEAFTYEDPVSPFRQSQYEDLLRGTGEKFKYDMRGRQSVFGAGLREFRPGSHLPNLVKDSNGEFTRFEDDGLGARIWSRFRDIEELQVGRELRMIWTATDFRAHYSLVVGSGSIEVDWSHNSGWVPYFRQTRSDGSPEIDFSRTGTVLRRYKQEPFGRAVFSHAVIGPTSPSTTGTVGIAGSRWQSSDSARVMGVRTYSGDQRRFVSPDPVVHADVLANGFNPFVYGYNNPENYPDPSGLDPPGRIYGPTEYIFGSVESSEPSANAIVLPPILDVNGVETQSVQPAMTMEAASVEMGTLTVWQEFVAGTMDELTLDKWHSSRESSMDHLLRGNLALAIIPTPYDIWSFSKAVKDDVARSMDPEREGHDRISNFLMAVVALGTVVEPGRPKPPTLSEAKALMSRWPKMGFRKNMSPSYPDITLSEYIRQHAGYHGFEPTVAEIKVRNFSKYWAYLSKAAEFDLSCAVATQKLDGSVTWLWRNEFLITRNGVIVSYGINP